MKKFKNFFVGTFDSWKKDGALSEGAALSFYSIVAFPALILSLLFIAGIFLEKETIQKELIFQSHLLFGNQGTVIVEQIIQNVPSQNTLKLASVFTLALLLFGAMGFFEQLQTALNKIWNVTPKTHLGWKGFFKNKALTFLMVLGLGGLIISTLFIEFILSFVLPFVQAKIPLSADLLQMAGLSLGFFITTFVFAFMYKYLPQVKIQWRDVFIGAIITSVLFTLGKYIIGFYLGKSQIATAYGAAGSLVAFLLWVYYSSQVIFLGAEFTQSYANTYGSKIKPDKDALRTDSFWNKLFRKM